MAIGIRPACTALEHAFVLPNDRDRDDLRSDRGVRDDSPPRPSQVLLDGFDLHDCHCFPEIAEYLINLLRRVKHGLYPRYLDHKILQRVDLVLLITQEDWSNCNQDFKEYRERQIILYDFAETAFWYTLFVDKTNE